MKKKTTISIVICFAAVFAAMLLLYWTSPISSDLKASSFDRNFTNPTITQEAILELENKNPYFAGMDDQNIYLGDYLKPYLLVKCDKDLKYAEKISLKMHGLDSVKSPARFRTIVDPPNFYMANGVMPTILRGKIGDWTAETFISDISDSNYYFSDVLPITQSSFALRSFSTYQKGYQLALLNEVDTPHFNFNFDLLKQQQQDGLFSVHGQMLSYKQRNKIVYVYTYRNQYLIIDSSLKKYQTNQTIDTFSIAPIKVGSYNNNTQHTLSTPQNIINGASCVGGKFLYIKSNLLAKNENAAIFTKSCTIDVYDLEQGRYAFSFHLPRLNQKPFSEIRVYNEKIYVTYGNNIVVYKVFQNPPNQPLSSN